jgi:hypothetical protein
MANLPTIEIPPPISFTLAGTLTLNCGGDPTVINSVIIGLRGTTFALPGANLWVIERHLTNIGGFGPPDWRAQLFVNGVEQEQIALGATIIDTTYFTPINFSGTLGPFRLGAELGSSAVPYVPNSPTDLAEYLAIVSTWWEDENTEYIESVGTESTDAFPAPSLRAITEDVARLAVAAFGFIAGTENVARFTNVQINGIDLDVQGLTLDDPHWEEVAAGDFNFNNPLNDIGDYIRFTAAPGGTMDYDVEVRDFAGSVIAGAEVLDTWLTTVELHNAVQKTPYLAHVPLTPTVYTVDMNTSYSRPSRNQPRAVSTGPNIVRFSMDPAWMAAQGWDVADLPMVMDHPSPLTGAPNYSPLAVTHKGAIEIDQPDGGRPSSWVINSGANGSVTEGATTVFVVTNTAARFARDYATNWRNYVTPAAPEFTVDGYGILKHNYYTNLGGFQTVTPEDVWWWNSYEFLKLNVTATAPARLTLLVEGIDLGISDGHDSSLAIRQASLGLSYYNEKRTYVLDVAGGPTDYWIDLSFPEAYVSESGAPFPMRRPRVDRVTLSSDAVGTFTLNSMQLSRRDAYANQTQVAYSPLSNYVSEIPALYTRVDGAATLALTAGDDYRKGQEKESGFGGAYRWVVPEVGLTMTAEGFVKQYDLIEGCDVTYTDAARAAFHQDGVGTEFVTRFTEPAQFVREETPGTDWTGAGDAHTWTPTLCIRVGQQTFPNGTTAICKGRKRLGGGVEAVVMAGGVRAGAGINFDVIDQASVTLGTVATDSRARVHFEPIGDGETVRFEAA